MSGTILVRLTVCHLPKCSFGLKHSPQVGICDVNLSIYLGNGFILTMMPIADYCDTLFINNNYSYFTEYLIFSIIVNIL